MNDCLFLVWYEEENKILNLIAKLTFEESFYKFEYLNFNNSDLQLFSKNGLFYGFEDVNQIYISDTLFVSIVNRLPSKKRVDYDKIMSRVDLDSNASDFDILKKTKGALSTDRFIFISEDELEKLKKQLEA